MTRATVFAIYAQSFLLGATLAALYFAVTR